jgi:hypothetical protein
MSAEMSQYHHHPDDLIYVRTDKATYSDTVTNFALDFERGWPLPCGIIELLYEDGAMPRHLQFDVGGNQFAGGLPFPFGDEAIAAIDALLAAQARRIAPPPPPLPVLQETPRKASSPSTGTNKV